MQEQISVNTSSIDLKVEKHVCAFLGSHRVSINQTVKVSADWWKEITEFPVFSSSSLVEMSAASIRICFCSVVKAVRREGFVGR